MTENMPSYFMQQSISIPFCWEEIPGKPKKNWKKKPTISQEQSIKHYPSKFIVSIPFKWEEKPGTPLPSFSQDSNDETEIILDEYSDIWESSIEGSFSSIPFLSMQPQNQKVLKDASPASPSSESDSKRYTNGASLLEWLFPLLSPHSSYLEKVGYPEKGVNKIQPMDDIKDYTAEIKKPPPPTLGELMMMSQRRSYHKTAMEMHTQSLRKETKKRKVFRCCINRLMGILRTFHMDWTRQHQLKLK